MSAFAIARASFLRIGRDRTALFFIIVLPIAVIVIVGATVRGFSTFRVGVLDQGAGSAGRQLTAALGREPGLAVSRYADLTALTKAVARGEVSAGVVLPRHMDDELRRGEDVAVPVLAEQASSTQQAAVTAVSSVVAGQGGLYQAARFVTGLAPGSGSGSGAAVASGFASASLHQNLARASSLAPHVARVQVRTVEAESRHNTLPEGYAYSAPTQLVLFVFITSVAAGAAIIETRRLGMYERMAAAPVRTSTIIVGEALTYLGLAVFQSLLIVIVGAVAFGVSWGDPLAAIALVVVWALVGTGAGMLAGTVFRTPEQANAIGPSAGIALGMLGGCMWPLAIVSATMRTVGHVTPQAWAVDAWTSLLSRSGTIVTVAPQLAVLGAFALGFLTLAAARLRRALV